jgi:AGCS family alanine or glycine:cation symporter
VLFAFTTLIGWAYYGEKCVEYLFGEKSIAYFRVLFTVIVMVGALLELELVWKISDIFNGLMALPNLIGLCALSKVVVQETKLFLAEIEKTPSEAVS